MTRKEREQAELLKRIDKAFGQKQYVKSKVTPVYPFSAERELRRDVDSYLMGVKQAVRSTIKNDGLIDVSKATAAIERMRTSSKLKSDIKKASDSVVAVSVKNLDRSAEKTVGVGLKMPKSYFEKSVVDWDDRTEKAIEDYVKTIGGRVSKATTESQIKQILATLNNGGKRLSRLTVTELNGAISEQMQMILGNDRYVWATARDDRVRPCHRTFDGRTFFWNNPPEIWEMRHGRRVYTGRHCHPGQDYNCRCVAIMVFNKDAFKKFLGLMQEEEKKRKKEEARKKKTEQRKSRPRIFDIFKNPFKKRKK